MRYNWQYVKCDILNKLEKNVQDSIVEKYKLLQKDYENLKQENIRLKELLATFNKENAKDCCKENISTAFLPKQAGHKHLSLEQKVALFISFFKGRNDIFARRWESKNGRAGYTPVCVNEWRRPLCQKPSIKCSQCANRDLLPMSNTVIHDHLAGKDFIGMYPLLKDDSCYFVALDFDKEDWRQDVKAFINTCQKFQISYALELSQSGNGAHIWIFFEEAIPAYLARKIGVALLTQTMQNRYQMHLDSYDRLFPNQDTMPKGGFGNLIALPLQGARRKEARSVFLDDDLQIISDQWQFLLSLKKISTKRTYDLLSELTKECDIIDVKRTYPEGESIDPWLVETKENDLVFPDPLPESIEIVLANQVYIPTDGLPSKLLNKIKKLAAFQNPEFYKAQAMRLPTYDKPRVIGCAQEFPKHIAVPRGCFSEVVGLLKACNVQSKIVDKRFAGAALKTNFLGVLRKEQKEVIKKLKTEDMGILAATTGFGKTVVAAKMIATRNVNTLVLVHRQQLMDQWREKLSIFLEIPINEIGFIGGGKNKASNKIDIGMLQSLFRKGEVNNIVSNYGQIIVDECHHISAYSFEQVLKNAHAKYVLGLTATPVRKDGHHPIIIMQCGPILFNSNVKKHIQKSSYEHKVLFRYTDFKYDAVGDIKISDLYAAVILDKKRNDLIFNDVLNALESGRSPLLLTERTEHLEYFQNSFSKFVKNLIVLKGGMGKKQREAVFKELASIPNNEERLIIATGRYIGEGFDDQRLDTLFLTMPISWHGTLQQYIGRLHREHDSKSDIMVYDYVDIGVRIFEKMYHKRLKKYKAIGYKVE